MLVELVDIKQKGKFRKTFIFNTYKGSYSKFQFDSKRTGGGWTTQLVSFHWPLVTQHYP